MLLKWFQLLCFESWNVIHLTMDVLESHYHKRHYWYCSFSLFINICTFICWSNKGQNICLQKIERLILIINLQIHLNTLTFVLLTCRYGNWWLCVKLYCKYLFQSWSKEHYKFLQPLETCTEISNHAGKFEHTNSNYHIYIMHLSL